MKISDIILIAKHLIQKSAQKKKMEKYSKIRIVGRGKLKIFKMKNYFVSNVSINNQKIINNVIIMMILKVPLEQPF